MIAGIGIDLCSIERLEQSLAKSPNLRARLFHETELELDIQSLAARFAAKEALAKALGNPRLLEWNQISLTKDENGKPSLALHGETKERIESLGIRLSHLSLSHDAGFAIAAVVLES